MYNKGMIDVSLFKEFEKIDDIKQFLAENPAIETTRLIFAYRDKTDGLWRATEKLTEKNIKLFLENRFNKTLIETAWYLNKAT